MVYNRDTMQRKIVSTFLLVLLLTFTLINLIPPRPVLAAPNANDLMAAVQALRSSKGLAPLIVNAALMASAQGHSNYQSTIGTWSHIGAGGSTPVSRAIAAGFGGGATVYISENVAIGNTAVGLDEVIYQIWGDPDHWNTMTSTLYVNAGAGVTLKNGVLYYTFDTGYLAGQAPLPTRGPGTPQGPGTPTQKPSTPVPTVPRIVPIVTSTPNPDGSVVHPVGNGQALINIASAYKMTLDDLRRLNKMTASSVLLAGQKLLIQPAFTPSAVPSITPTQPSATPTLAATRTPTLEPTGTRSPSETPTQTPTPVSAAQPLENIDRRSLGTVIIAVCGMGLLLVVVGQVRKKA
jgi:uncharacterized protein YkwD